MAKLGYACHEWRAPFYAFLCLVLLRSIDLLMSPLYPLWLGGYTIWGVQPAWSPCLGKKGWNQGIRPRGGHYRKRKLSLGEPMASGCHALSLVGCNAWSNLGASSTWPFCKLNWAIMRTRQGWHSEAQTARSGPFRPAITIWQAAKETNWVFCYALALISIIKSNASLICHMQVWHTYERSSNVYSIRLDQKSFFWKKKCR